MKKKLLIIISSIIGVFLLAGGGYACYLFNTVKASADQMHEPLKLSTPHEKPNISGGGNSKSEDQPERTGPDPISILLLGVDERKGDSGRSDTLIVATLNTSKKTMQMVSIPRDTRTEIIGHGTVDKINHAYAFGGPSMSVETVENFTGIKIDYFIKMNMEALSQLVDAVGGVTVENALDWYEGGPNGFHYKKGKLELNGKRALGYVRMRHDDPNGDFGRNERQRQIVMAILMKAASITSVGKYDDILHILGDNVQTNLTFDNMMDIQKNYRDVRANIEQYEVKGQGGKIDGIYYLTVPDEEREKVSQMLKSNLER
ncbi:LCP family protein [Falsibacillus pallidus]|uniref:LytR family transcriptional attenuator n=1 Tax=Falsibacillus pallidus TaxID=493781 RepID=A0A370GEY8_9BACI|nr:LCP family protein [Falsibacillus pallidus]RDI41669.1 LytR family transcriptional attenuator [Falsibacillus pallidus]